LRRLRGRTRIRRPIVVATLVVAGISCAQADPTNFLRKPQGSAATAFQHSTPANPSFGHLESDPRRPQRLIAQQAAANEQLRRKAEALYKATGSDAETFEAALLIPEIRLKIESALHQKLSDQMLRRLAAQAKAEAVYWYQYMQGLEARP